VETGGKCTEGSGSVAEGKNVRTRGEGVGTNSLGTLCTTLVGINCECVYVSGGRRRQVHRVSK